MHGFIFLFWTKSLNMNFLYVGVFYSVMVYISALLIERVRQSQSKSCSVSLTALGVIASVITFYKQLV